MLPVYQLIAQLEQVFDLIIEQSLTLVAYVEKNPQPYWSLEEKNTLTSWLKQALTDFWYQDGQDGRVTKDYIGLLCADQSMLDMVHLINQHKDHMALLIHHIKQQSTSAITEIKATLPFRHPVLHQQLKGAGLARLHLKQCWRHLPIAAAPLDRVRLSWYSSGRSIKKMTVAEVEARLQRLDFDAPHIQLQYQQLMRLPDNEMLAQVQPLAPIMRANLFFTEALTEGRSRQAMNIALPLFCPVHNEMAVLPDHNHPAARPPDKRQRARRRDTKLEDEPFIPSLRIYRYRN